MKKIRSFFTIICSVLISMLVLTGCGGHAVTHSDIAAGSYKEMAAPMMAEPSMSYSSDMVSEEAEYEWGETDDYSNGGNKIDVSQRKLIRNIDASVQVKESGEITALIKRINDVAVSFGGYKMSENSGSGYSSYGSINVKVPSDKADAFLDGLRTGGVEFTTLNDNLQDVTMKYTDIESRLASSKAAKDRYIKLMDTAESVSDVLEIQARLDDIIADEESYQSQLNVLKNQVDFTDINISISCVRNVEKETFGSKFAREMGYIADEIGETIIWGIEWILTSIVRLIFIIPVAFIVIKAFLFAIGKKKLFTGKPGLKKLFGKKKAEETTAGSAAVSAQEVSAEGTAAEAVKEETEK